MELLKYGFIQHAVLAALLMSVSCGIIGTYIVSRRMVFISGGITHASFGGVGIGYYLGFSPLAGAAAVAILAALTTENLTRRKVMRNDSIIAILWSLGMAIGIIFVYLAPGYAPNLMSYLFGSIITVTNTDLWLMLALALAVTTVSILFYRPILYVAFDEQFARIRGIPVMFINYLLIILTALTIVLSIRTAGIILVLSVLTIPQNISNLFTRRFSHIMIGSVILGFFASLLGLILSYYMDIPSGATIIFTLVILYLLARLIKVAIFGR
ncbi:MAG: metal ABC transporter permease [Bacteroidales bacterium]|nr:metal ABC transporter permease [Bacteroidales bacterium]